MAPKAHRPSLGAVLVAFPIGIALTLLAALPSYFNLATEQIFEEQKSLLLRSAALVALSLATPALYLAGLVIAAGIARSIAQSRRAGPAACSWPQSPARFGSWCRCPSCRHAPTVSAQRLPRTRAARVDARLLRADLRLRGREWQPALDDYDAVLARDSRNVPAWRGRVAGLVQHGRFDEAQAALGEGLKLAPADDRLLAQRDALKAR